MRIAEKLVNDSPTPAQTDESHYRDIVNRHLEFIEIQCRKALGWDKQGKDPGDNETLELNNRVLDKLRENNFKILRKFQGKAKISTYITAVIARQAVDFLREKKGRKRTKERAAKHGQLGEVVYEKIIKAGQPVAHAYKEMQTEYGYGGSLQDIEVMLDKIKGSARPKGLETIPAGYQNPDSGEIIVPDPHDTPEQLAIESGRMEKIKETVAHIVAGLSGEERLILRMRFPIDEDEKPKEIDQIAKLLGTSKKAVYHRITRILKKCRDLSVHSGVKGNDIF